MVLLYEAFPLTQTLYLEYNSKSSLKLEESRFLPPKSYTLTFSSLVTILQPTGPFFSSQITSSHSIQDPCTCNYLCWEPSSLQSSHGWNFLCSYKWNFLSISQNSFPWPSYHIFIISSTLTSLWSLFTVCP